MKVKDRIKCAMLRTKAVSLKFILVGVLWCMCLFWFTGCGPEIMTQMELTQEFQGKRVMTVTLTRAELKEWCKVSAEQLNQVLQENTPAELEYHFLSDDNGYVFSYTLSFSNLDEYQNKIEKLTGKRANVLLEMPKTPFTSGVMLTDDTESQELLAWLPKVLVEQNCIEKGNASYVLNNGVTTVIFDGQEYISKKNGVVEIKNLKQVKINGISFYTDLMDEEISRRIVIEIPRESYLQKSEEMDTYLKAHVPVNATGEWSQGKKDSYCYTIQIPACSFMEFQNAMGVFYETRETCFRYEELHTDYLFDNMCQLTEQVNLKAFLSDDETKINCFFYMKDTMDELSAEYRIGDNEKSVIPNLDPENAEYYYVSNETETEYAMIVKSTNHYQPAKVEILDVLSEKGYLKRKIDFSFPGVIRPKEADRIESKILKQSDSVQIEQKKGKKDHRITLTMENQVTEYETAYAELFHNQSAVVMEKSNQFLKFQLPITIKGQISLEQFYKEPVVVTYRLKTDGRLDPETLSAGETTDRQVKKKELMLKTKSGQISYSVEGYLYNRTLYGVVAVAVVILVLFVVLSIYCKVIYPKKKARAESTMSNESTESDEET